MIGVGLREAARQLGMAAPPLKQAIELGRVIPEPDGSIDVEKARISLAASRRRPGPAPSGTSARPAATQSGETLAAVILRKEAALAELREIEVAKARGDLLPAEEVLTGWQDAIGRARALLLRIPFAAAPEVIAALGKGPNAVATILRQHIEDALLELADTDAHDDDEPDDEPEPRPVQARRGRKPVAPAAKAHAKPVGRAELPPRGGRKRVTGSL